MPTVSTFSRLRPINMHLRAQAASQYVQGSMRPQYTYITINIGYSHNKASRWIFVLGAQQEMAAVSIHKPAGERHSDPVSVCYWFLLKKERREEKMFGFFVCLLLFFGWVEGWGG